MCGVEKEYRMSEKAFMPAVLQNVARVVALYKNWAEAISFGLNPFQMDGEVMFFVPRRQCRHRQNVNKRHFRISNVTWITELLLLLLYELDSRQTEPGVCSRAWPIVPANVHCIGLPVAVSSSIRFVFCNILGPVACWKLTNIAIIISAVSVTLCVANIYYICIFFSAIQSNFNLIFGLIHPLH